MQKAQLILVGGRASIPNILTIIHQDPDVIVAVSSTESRKDVPRLEDAIKAVLPTCRVETTNAVDAFDFSQIYNECEEAVKKYPMADWIFNITTGTTIMSLGAYEVAKQYKQSMHIRCWYLNTSQTRVVSLLEDEFSNVDGETIFEIDVPQYAAAYNRVLSPGDLDNERTYAEQQWLAFAQRLGKAPYSASLIKQVMSKIGNRPGKDKDGEDKSKDYTLTRLPDAAYSLLEEAQNFQLVSQLSKNTSSISFHLNYLQDKFLNGSWLEAYVWDEARKLNLFYDCQWNHTITDGKSKNELDVAMTYKAQLLIAECKTGEEESFDSKTIYKLDSVANLLGGKFVGRVLVTSLPLPMKKQEFMEQAESRRVIVLTAEDLPTIGAELAKEAVNPRFSRI